MKELPPLPKSELEIARIVWRLQEATVREIVEELANDREADFWTVQTYLRRLANKGYLKVRKEGRTNIYAPAVDLEGVISQVFEETVERLFDGKMLPAFQQLVNSRDLTESDIDELQTLLNGLKAERKRKRGKSK
ncbi:MAG: transcriptional regulator [Planctomyces sp.]|nr:transcriptional regulator [Planctomyces sp.]